MPHNRFRILVTDNDHGSLDQERQVLAAAGLDAALIQAQCRTEDEVIAAGRSADALLVQYARITRRVLQACSRVRVVVCYGVGVDPVDLAAATERGVYVAHVPDYCTDEVSDHALALLLALARKVVLQANACREGRWDSRLARPVRRLRGQIVGLVGLGRIGRAFAAKVHPLGVEVLARDPNLTQREASPHSVTLVSLPELLASSDYLVNLAPLTADTRHLIGEAELQAIKPGACIVSISRGGIVDEAALLRALREGRLAGAALDVRESEPPPVDELMRMDNVIHSPHTAFYSEESIDQLKREAMREVVRVLQGGRPRWVANGEVMRERCLRREAHGDGGGVP
jgi:D-3-phosphoglycerate dehydrogenase / 2-oxoglutarate reductase